MATTGFNNVEYVRVLRLTNTNLIENIEACAPDSVFTGGVVVTHDMRGYIERGSTYDSVANACSPPTNTMAPYYVWDPVNYAWEIDQEMYNIVEEQWALGNKCNGPCA